MSEENPSALQRGDRVDRNWVTINKLNVLLQPALVELRRLSSAITDLRERPSFKAGGGSGSAVQRFRVMSEQEDYLTCQKEDSFGGLFGVSILVAKPRTLRFTTWQAATIGDWSYNGTKNTRNATYAGPPIQGGLQPGNLIAEILDPPYTGGELIASQVTGDTAVVVTGTGRLKWIDLNADARRFIATRDRVEVCKMLNGVAVSRQLVIEGGPPF